MTKERETNPKTSRRLREAGNRTLSATADVEKGKKAKGRRVTSRKPHHKHHQDGQQATNGEGAYGDFYGEF